MKTDKTKLLQDIKAMKEKLASMEEELNKPEEFKHFPSKEDKYYFYNSMGNVSSTSTSIDDLRVNVFKTKEEAEKAYNKDVALEKIKRRLLELQGDWHPNWKDSDERKVVIVYSHCTGIFEKIFFDYLEIHKDFPYMKSMDIAETIINEMENELKVLFDIA